MEIELLPEADTEAYSYRNKAEYTRLVRYKLLTAKKLRNEVESVALSAWRVLGCRDAGRIDLRMDDLGKVNFIEVNPLAGIHPVHSDLPMMAGMTGMSYSALIGTIMDSALKRCLIPAQKFMRVA